MKYVHMFVKAQEEMAEEKSENGMYQ